MESTSLSLRKSRRGPSSKPPSTGSKRNVITRANMGSLLLEKNAAARGSAPGPQGLPATTRLGSDGYAAFLASPLRTLQALKHFESDRVKVPSATEPSSAGARRERRRGSRGGRRRDTPPGKARRCRSSCRLGAREPSPRRAPVDL